MNINKKISYYGSKTITDSDIMKNVGVVTYGYICYKYPNIFMHFKECDELYKYSEGKIPPYINIYMSEDPLEVKADLIRLICNEEPLHYGHSFLINSSPSPIYPLLEKENSIYEWIFICIVMIILIIISLWTVYKLDKNKKSVLPEKIPPK